ncbi:MAG: hypothetical protein RIQ68_1742 [Pseudomonadota bacterium]|jgi:hypothetical protein
MTAPVQIESAPQKTAPSGAEILLAVEAAAREAGDLTELSHVMANETRKLIRCGQAHVFRLQNGKLILLATSSLSSVERTSPLVQDLEALVAPKLSKLREPAGVTLADLRGAETQRLADMAYLDFLLCPLLSRSGVLVGALLLARNEMWAEREVKLVQRLCGAYTHAWVALVGEKRVWIKNERVRKYLLPGSLVAGFLIALFPVPLTALAPCEIVPLDPETVTAPLDGIIQTIAVEPNQWVQAGQGLLNFVDTTIRGRLEVAERAVEVAAAKERRLQQAAFDDRNARRDLSIAAAELKLAVAERDAAADQLARTRVTTSRAGLAIFASRKDWEGRPVSTGERIMQIAAPECVQLRIDMPVKDAPVVRDQARVRVYLDSDPLNPLNGILERATYHATPMAGGGLAFVLYAKLPDGEAPRIGYRGTAQVFGDDVALIYYLLRRPLTAVRQMVGL